MGTSLAEQLNRLKTPQTGILLEDKKRPSLLFDPKEAANLDRETVLNIGQSGLRELIKLSNVFEEFEQTLFGPSSMSFERSVQDKNVNRKLDSSIDRFLTFLSPYFLLNVAHKALEWLVYRYRIHQFNMDQFLLLILPYHETRIFVRALQLMDLSNPADQWHWLNSLQKPGVPLPTITMINRITVDAGLLKRICNHVIQATRTYSDQASCLSTLYAFYSINIIGAIDHLPTVTEIQFNHLLPALLKGLTSATADFAASSYMILAKLITKIEINSETVEKILLKIFKKPELKQEAVLITIYLYETPLNPLKIVPDSLVLRLLESQWFMEIATKMQSSGTDVSKFIGPFLRSACNLALKDEKKTNEIQHLIHNILGKIKLKDNEVDLILSSILKKDMFTTDLPDESKKFLINIYQSLERGYPTRFDEYLKTLMKSNETDNESKLVLQFLTTWHFGSKGTQDSVNVLDKLGHANPEQRIMALEVLKSGDVTIPESFQEMMTNTLLARFNDNETNVIRTLLDLPKQLLIKLIPTDTLVDELISLLLTCHTNVRKVLAKPAFKLLLELCEEGDDTSVFLTSLPYLFPNEDKDVEIAMEILKSNFATKNAYMQNVKKDIGNTLSVTAVSSAAFHNILNHEILPPTDAILNAMKQQISYGDAGPIFFNLILLGSVCRVPVGSLQPKLALQVIEMATGMIKNYSKVKSLKNDHNITGDNVHVAIKLTSQGILPLQVGTYVLEMVHRRLNIKSNPIFDFENDPDRSHLILRLLEMFFEGIDKNEWSKHYSRCLQIFFQRHFDTVKDTILFLCQLYTKPVKVQTSFHCLQICLVLLNECKSKQWALTNTMFITNLLVCLSRKNNECRKVAVDILKNITQTFHLTIEPFSVFLKELALRSFEMTLDGDQISLILYVLLSPDPDVTYQLKSDTRRKMQQTREQLFEYIMDSNTPIHMKSQLLDILVHVNGAAILEQLAPLGLDLLQKLNTEPPNLFANNALKNILQRFNDTSVRSMRHSQVYELFEKSLDEHAYQLPTESGSKSPSVISLKQITESFFDSLKEVSTLLQQKIINKMLDIITNSDVNIVVTNASKVMRRIRIDAQLLVNELKIMKQYERVSVDPSKIKRQRRISQSQSFPDPGMVNSVDWKRGITLLEIIQHTDNLDYEKLLYPILFDLLKTCLSFEEQSPVEYTNQLLLSAIDRLILKRIPIHDVNQQVVLIAQCIRTSRNPQTHHHALLVLVELLKMMDIQSALCTIMPIFTFMGNSVVRQDDAYSIQIISKTLETVVPIVNLSKDETHACEILRTFIVSLPDIPEHRRTPLFMKLLQLLDNRLHLYYLLTFESHVLSRTVRINNETRSSQRLEFALQISREFTPQRLIRVAVKLTEFMKELPIDIEEEKDRKIIMSFRHKHVYDVYKNTPKNLRHYKYTLIQFLSNLLSSPDFVNRVGELGSEEIDKMKHHYEKLIVQFILLIESTSSRADFYLYQPIGKYWKVLLHHLYDLLDLINNLLPNNIFLTNIKRLLNHTSISVKKKAPELLNIRLQQKKFVKEDHQELLLLIEPLTEIIKDPFPHPDFEILKQTVLISLKLLAKLLANDHPSEFKPILKMTTRILRNSQGPVMASAVLCVAELCSSMRTYAIDSLNKFVPAIIGLMETRCQDNVPDVTTISIISALQKIVESVGNFLSLYMDPLLFELARLHSLYTDKDHPKVSIVLSRLKAIEQKLAICIPLRVLLPGVSRTYEFLLENKHFKRIPPLLNILAESFGNVEVANLNAAIPDLATFFLKVFQFREDVLDNDEAKMEMNELDIIIISQDILVVEESASKALVSLVLKLSETTFRPLYYKLYDWAVRHPQFLRRNITFFRLSANIAECLKSLYVLFAGHFLRHAASLLSSNNIITEKSSEFTLPDDLSKIELVEAILLTLHRVFTYDSHNFVNQERFEILAQPIVDEIENTIGTTHEYEKRANELIIPCIASFVGAIPDDSLHKQLVYQILLKTRHAKAYVRSTGLKALVEVARRLGEDFMPLLPETVPFLAELLEDEDESTEKHAQEAVRTLEDILGEPLQKYF